MFQRLFLSILFCCLSVSSYSLDINLPRDFENIRTLFDLLSNKIYAAGYTETGISNDTQTGCTANNPCAVIARYSFQSSSSEFATRDWIYILGIYGNTPGEIGFEHVTWDPSTQTIYASGRTYGYLQQTNNNGLYDIYYAAFSSTGSKLIDGMFGTTGGDESWGIKFDALSKNCYFYGYRASISDQMFISYFNSTMRALTYSSNAEYAGFSGMTDIVLTHSNIWVLSQITNPLQGRTDEDIYIASMDRASLSYSSPYFFGSMQDENPKTIFVDESRGLIFISGATAGSLNSFNNQGGLDSFILALNVSTYSRVWTYQSGTPWNDVCEDMTQHINGDILVPCYTYGSSYFSVEINSFMPNGTLKWTLITLNTSDVSSSYDAFQIVNSTFSMSTTGANGTSILVMSLTTDGYIIDPLPGSIYSVYVSISDTASNILTSTFTGLTTYVLTTNVLTTNVLTSHTSQLSDFPSTSSILLNLPSSADYEPFSSEAPILSLETTHSVANARSTLSDIYAESAQKQGTEINFSQTMIILIGSLIVIILLVIILFVLRSVVNDRNVKMTRYNSESVTETAMSGRYLSVENGATTMNTSNYNSTTMTQFQTTMAQIAAIPGYMELQGNQLKTESKIGEGAYGLVYKGLLFEDNSQVTQVAIKVIKEQAPGLFRQQEDVQTTSFKQELAIMSVLMKFDCVVQLRGFLMTPMTLVMKWYDYGTLSDVIHRESSIVNIIDSQWTPRLVVDFSSQIFYAISAIHSMGIVHGDLKPVNILLDRSPPGNLLLKIADFGAASFLTDDLLKVHAFKVSDIAGLSRPYAAPEQFEGEIFFAGDVWAGAVCGMEIMCRQRPWQGFSRDEIVLRVKAGDTPDKHIGYPKSNPFIREFLQIMRRAWCLDHTQRPSASEMLGFMSNVSPTSFDKPYLQ